MKLQDFKKAWWQFLMGAFITLLFLMAIGFCILISIITTHATVTVSNQGHFVITITNEK